MFRKIVLSLLFTLCHYLVCSGSVQSFSEFKLNHAKLQLEKDQVNYSLNEIIRLIDSSIHSTKGLSIPPDCTEFERTLFIGRRIQHRDSQLVAIQIFKNLLEFNYYRTEGERLYLTYLLAMSMKYIGSPLIAKSYMDDVFPNIEKYITNYKIVSKFKVAYATLNLRIDSNATANRLYREVLHLALEKKDTLLIHESFNNYGYSFYKLEMYDSAAYYYRLNQTMGFRSFNPILYAFSFGNYGAAIQQLNQPDSAIYYYKKEVRLLQEVKSEEGLQNTYSTLADVYYELQQYDSALLYYNKTILLSQKKGLKKVELATCEKLLNLYALELNDQGLVNSLTNYFNKNKSSKAFLEQKTLQDEIHLSRFLEILNSTKLTKQKMHDLEHHNRYLVIVISTLILILIFLIFFIIYRYRSRKNLAIANNSLTEKNNELLKSYQTLKESNERNETLLKELHHRVKNNLQMVSSLFNLQLNIHDTDQYVKEIFKSAKDRIQSISLIHKTIYQSDQFAKINFKKYLKAFADEIITSNNEGITINYEIKEFDLSIDKAVPLGLIINELFSNSIKHAKANQNLIIEIKQLENHNDCMLVYQDNGQGITLDTLDIENSDSMGIMLIKLLSNQLEAKIEFKESEKDKHGFWFSITGKFK